MPPLSPAVVGALLFAALLGLLLSTGYFLIEAPAKRRDRRRRLLAMQEAVREPEPERAAAHRRRRVGSTSAWPGAAWLERRLGQAGLGVPPQMIVLQCLGCAASVFVLAAALRLPVPVGLAASAAAGLVPLAVIELKRSRRLAAFDEQFPEAVDLLARAVRAGHAFTTGFELIAMELAEPVAGEFQLAYEQQNLGLSLRDTLDDFAARVPSDDVKVFVSALQIQRETGGNLAEILEKLGHVTRERFKLQRQIRVLTAEGRLSLYVLTAVPILTALILTWVNPSYLSRLGTDPLGRKLAWSAGVMVLIGYLVIRRMTNVKV